MLTRLHRSSTLRCRLWAHQPTPTSKENITVTDAWANDADRTTRKETNETPWWVKQWSDLTEASDLPPL